MTNAGQELLNVPFPVMVTKLTLGIAEAQTKLHRNSAEVTKFMAGTDVDLPDLENPTSMKPFPLIARGFFPGFYQVQEAVIEVKMAISMTRETEVGVDGEVEVN